MKHQTNNVLFAVAMGDFKKMGENEQTQILPCRLCGLRQGSAGQHIDCTQ